MTKVPLRVSHHIIRSISDQYSSVPHRVIMEFIDNSLDSAEEFFDASTNSYRKEITIQVLLNTRAIKPSISVQDNCTGILDVERVVKEIGNSNKKSNQWTNGQFGFGIYSFMAIADSLIISTRNSNNNGKTLELKRSFFEQEETPEIDIIDTPILDVGTTIRLTGFDDDVIDEITLDSIQNDINKHFEKLLERKNLRVTLISDGVIRQCRPYDYSEIPGTEIHEQIDELVLDRKGTRKLLALMGKKPIEIYLKVAKNVLPDRAPVFISKGRRINEIKNISSFRSFNKSKVWGHPNVTGYVDLGDILTPELDRKDFVSNRESRAVYKALIALEDKLLAEINQITQESDSRNFKKLEDHLNKILSKLAREDAIQYREQFSSGGDKSLVGNGSPEEFSNEVEGGKDFGDSEKNTTSTGTGVGKNEEGAGIGTEDNPDGSQPGSPNEGTGPSNEESLDLDTGFQGRATKRGSGLDITIISGEPQKNIDGSLARSTCVDGCIRIYKEHPDFIERLKQKRSGKTIITQKLITYLAGEITIWYQDILCRKHGQQEYNVDMFRNVMSFLYRFENGLGDLEGKLLSSLQDTGEGEKDE